MPSNAQRSGCIVSGLHFVFWRHLNIDLLIRFQIVILVLFTKLVHIVDKPAQLIEYITNVPCRLAHGHLRYPLLEDTHGLRANTLSQRVYVPMDLFDTLLKLLIATWTWHEQIISTFFGQKVNDATQRLHQSTQRWRLNDVYGVIPVGILTAATTCSNQQSAYQRLI